MAKWPNLKIIRVWVPPEVLYNHMWAVMNAYNTVDFEFPVAIRASLPSATTCLERPYLLGPLGGRYIQVLLYLQISYLLVVFGQLVILSDRALLLMTSNPQYIPLVDIIHGHFHKSFELLIKIGLWLVVNSECCLWSEGFPTVLMSAASGCKLAKLGWNKIKHQNTSFQYLFHFYPISGIYWTLKMPYVFLAFRGLHENMISLLFH